MDNCVIPSPNLCTSYVLYDIDGGGIGVRLNSLFRAPIKSSVCTDNCVILSPNLCTSYILYDIDGGGIGVSLNSLFRAPIKS